MTAQLLPGKLLAQQIYQNITLKIQDNQRRGSPPPGLAVILVGQNPASQIYIRQKMIACQNIGIPCTLFPFSEDITQDQLLELIDQLNQETSVCGILVQLPLPPPLEAERIIAAIDPQKDADGYHPLHLGNLFLGHPTVHPCTALAVMELLKHTEEPLAGKDAIVIGTSPRIGRAIALELHLKKCTVTLCHRQTRQLPQKIQQADIVVAAMGQPEFIQGDWIKLGAIVIDVGINRLENGKIVGDVQFDQAKEKAQWITPVPGGVGPLTVAMLLRNVLEAQRIQQFFENHR